MRLEAQVEVGPVPLPAAKAGEVDPAPRAVQRLGVQRLLAAPLVALVRRRALLAEGGAVADEKIREANEAIARLVRS